MALVSGVWCGGGCKGEEGACLAGEGDGSLLHAGPDLGLGGDGRALLHDLLEAPLHAAVPPVERDGVPCHHTRPVSACEHGRVAMMFPEN